MHLFRRFYGNLDIYYTYNLAELNGRLKQHDSEKHMRWAADTRLVCRRYRYFGSFAFVILFCVDAYALRWGKTKKRIFPLFLQFDLSTPESERERERELVNLASKRKQALFTYSTATSNGKAVPLHNKLNNYYYSCVERGYMFCIWPYSLFILRTQ